MIKGCFFDGKTSDKKDVLLYYNDNGMLGFTETQHREKLSGETPFDQVAISSRIGNTPRYIDFPDGSQFETNDNDAVDKLINNFRDDFFHGLLHKLESAKTIVFITTISLIGFGWLFVQYGIPYGSKVIADRLPIKASQYLGQGVLELMDKQWFKKSRLSAERQQALLHKFSRLKQTIPDSDYFNLVFRKGGFIGANAFALPDGTIVFTDELIRLTDNNQELVSIMLHEIGHLKQRHSLRATIQQSSLAIFIVAITGDISTSSSLITALPFVLVESGFSQGMETEADTFALEYMQQHDISPLLFATMMEKLVVSFSDTYAKCLETEKTNDAKKCIQLALQSNKRPENKKSNGVMDYFSTHPSSNERILRFRQSE